MKRLVLLALLAGCRFEVAGLELDAAVELDGGEPDALDAGVELGPAPVELGVADLRVVFDLSRPVPDGALPRQVGYPCDVANDCAGGLCIDGYCCDDLCDPFDPTNKCRACNVPGSEGHCVNALDGTDPRGLCDPAAVSSCGQDGTCDGKGGCRDYTAGTQCGSGSCANGSATAPPACDGLGHCLPGFVSAPCTPYACAANGVACATSCSAGGGCATGMSCDSNGECGGKAALGAPCAGGGDCASGQCWQSVCCNSDCSGNCRSCNQPGAAGFCLFVAAGTDPFDQCAAASRQSCGLDGQCDGAGSCRKWQSGTPCQSRVCNGDFTVAPRFCSGAGTCLPGVMTSCMPYTCNGATGVCFGQPCASDMQCAGRNKCRKDGTCG